MTKKKNAKKSGTSIESISVRFNSIVKNVLQSEEDLFKVSHSKSTVKNIRLARRVIAEFSSKLDVQDPKKFTPETLKFLINLLYSHCYMGTPTALSDDTMGGLTQEIRKVYLENGHRGPWHVDAKEEQARGNPLIGNEDIKRLRASYRVYLAHIGRTKRRARPISVALVCEHAKRFWFGCSSEIDYRDVLLHIIMVNGLNIGLRYDEVCKIRMENVTVVPGAQGTGNILLYIPESIKNSTKGREYELKQWPGNTKMRTSMIMDPFLALLSWINTRGNTEGFLFCDVNSKNMIVANKSWSVSDFTESLRMRLRLCGVGSGSLMMYSGHSLKREAVKHYRSLGIMNEQIMEIIQLNGVVPKVQPIR